MKTLIGLVTYGNFDFTRLTIEEIRRTTTRPYDLFCVVGKPGDRQTAEYLFQQGIWFVEHPDNLGFPAGLNDIQDFAFNPEARGRLISPRLPACGQYDYLICAGNDIVPFPGAIDALIGAAEDRLDWEWFCGAQLAVQTLVSMHPEVAKYFQGPSFAFTDFSARPWDVHTDHRPPGLEPHRITDAHNLAGIRRSVFEKIGYVDVNFFPAYFEDNDYVHRADLAGVRGCLLPHAGFFHFWSRTIHQGSGGSTPGFFQANARFYGTKWGGPPLHERWKIPFDGRPHPLCAGVNLDPVIRIGRRDQEEAIVAHWRHP